MLKLLNNYSERSDKLYVNQISYDSSILVFILKFSEDFETQITETKSFHYRDKPSIEKKFSIDIFANRNKSHLKQVSIENFQKKFGIKPSSKSRKRTDELGLILAMDTKSKFSKFGPITHKSKHEDIIASGSRDRGTRRSKHKSKTSNKWKLSPYKKKLASKIMKLKNAINDTPDKAKQIITAFQKKRFTISEYSNFINGTDMLRMSHQSAGGKRTSSRDYDIKKGGISDKEMLNASSQQKSRSKRAKSNKFTFLTINNYG